MWTSGEMFSPPGWLSSGCPEWPRRLCSWRFLRFTWYDLTANSTLSRRLDWRFYEVRFSLNYSEIIGSSSYTKISPRVHLYMPGSGKLDVYYREVQVIMCAPLEGGSQIVFPLIMCYCPILQCVCVNLRCFVNGIVCPCLSCSVCLLPVSPSNEDMKE